MAGLMGNPSSKRVTHYFVYFIVFILLLILLGRYMKARKGLENFDDFSPYNNPKAKIEKEIDSEKLEVPLNSYEKRSSCDGGYKNMDPLPLNPLYSYPTLSFHPISSPEEEVRKATWMDVFDMDLLN